MPAQLAGSKDILRRYTDLPALLYLLHHKKLTLLDPKTWDDTNDSYYLLTYKQKKRLGTVLALCMTGADETYHHWRVFSSGASGVCVHFDKEVLTSALRLIPGLCFRDVAYKKVRERGRAQTSPLKVNDLPFIKREPFAAEKEFRILYETAAVGDPFIDVVIPTESLLKITLSPWLNRRLADTVKDTVHSVTGWHSLKIVRSTLTGNSEWKNKADGAI